MLNFGFQSHKQNLSRFRIPDYIKVRYNGQEKRAAGFVLLQNEWNRAFSLRWPASMQIYWNKRNRSHVLITSPPSLLKGSGKQFSYSNQRRLCPSYDQYRGKEWWVSRRNLNSRYGSTRVWIVRKQVAYFGCACYEIHPKLKAGRSSWRICRHASHFFEFTGVMTSSLSVKKNHCSSLLVGTLSRVVATHA